jgi:acetylornithine deacetylase/succinyl-diaminopimelate desuccinylase-like protein
LNRILEYLNTNRDRHLLELLDFLRIPSVSAASDRVQDMTEAACWLAEHMKKIGLQNVKIINTERHPLITGEWINSPGLPTVLIYGHYDVQPVDPENLWDSPPFDPVIKEGKVYARGASDDKGQLFMHLKAVETLLAVEGRLPLNMRFLFEGEEEIGSDSLYKFLADGRLERPDVVIISDTNMVGPDRPAICYGLRGIVTMELSLQTAQNDLHSGLYGGAVPNALHELAKLVTRLHQENGKVAIPGFYDDVLPITDEEKEWIKALPFEKESFMKESGIDGLTGEEGFSPLEQMWCRPTLEINGLWGGFIQEGTKTVIPAKAYAKLSCRLVAHQNPRDIFEKTESYLLKIAPDYCDIKLSMKEGAKAWICPTDHSAVQGGLSVLAQAFSAQPLLVRGGGSIPIVEAFYQHWEVPVVLMGFGLPTDRVHAPNENFDLDVMAKGMYSLCLYPKALAQALTEKSGQA